MRIGTSVLSLWGKFKRKCLKTSFKSGFFKCEKKFYCILDNTKNRTPSLPIVCLSTGTGHAWKELEGKKRTSVNISFNLLSDHISTDRPCSFGSINPATLFVYYDNEGKHPFIGLRLVDDFIVGNKKSPTPPMNQVSYHAVNLCQATLCFGESCLLEFINEVKKSTVKPIIPSLRTLLSKERTITLIPT